MTTHNANHWRSRRNTSVLQTLLITIVFGGFFSAVAQQTAFSPYTASIDTPVVAKQKPTITATVGQGGRFTLTITGPAGNPSLKAFADYAGGGKGKISFDMTDELTRTNSAYLAEGWTLALFSPNADGTPAGETTDAKKAASTATIGKAASDAAAKTPDPATNKDPKVSIALTRPLREGDDVVKGNLTGNSAGTAVDKVRVTVFSASGSAIGTDEAAPTNNTFSVPVSRRLAAGQNVKVAPFLKGEALQNDSKKDIFDVDLVQSSGFDWGRVRAYFSFGATVAQEDKTVTAGTDPSLPVSTTNPSKTTRTHEFSSLSYFVGFNGDWNWYTNLRDRNPCPRPEKQQEEIRLLKELIENWTDAADKKRLEGYAAGTEGSRLLAQTNDLIARVKEALKQVVTAMKDAEQSSNCLTTEQVNLGFLDNRVGELTNISKDIVEETKKPNPDRKKVQEAIDALRVFRPTDADSLASEVRNGIAGNSTLSAMADAPAIKALYVGNPVVEEAAKGQYSALMGKTALETVLGRISDLDDALQDFIDSDPDHYGKSFLINTAFDSRLGQAATTGGASATTVIDPAAIVQHPNSAYVGAVVYAPFWPESWSWRHSDGNDQHRGDQQENALFIAPILKGGILAATTGPVTVTGTTESPTLFRHVFPSISAGIRFGHYVINPQRKSVSPELISYLDITYGRFDNFRLPRHNIATPSITDYVPPRFEIEGLLKLPETPIYIGFNANIGRGPDDLRFFLGTRFDFSKALTKLLAPTASKN